MITVSDALRIAQNRQVREPTAKITFRRQRLIFEEFADISNPDWEYADDALIGGEPYVFGDIIVTSGGYIFKLWSDGLDDHFISTDDPNTSGNWTWTQVPTGSLITAPGNANPGLYETGGTVYVFYLSTGAALKYVTCDEDGTGWSSEQNAGTATFPNGSCVAPVSENEVFICGATDGAITVQRMFNDGGWSVESMPYRFYGNETWAVTGTELGSVSRFDAVQLPDGTNVLFVTLNDPGESYIIRHKDGVWGDPQRLPGDEYGQLTLYRASLIGDKLWLTGRMVRPGPETVDAQEWDCVLISKDGENWEFHRDQYFMASEVRGKYVLLDGAVWCTGIATVYRGPATHIIDSSDPASMKTEIVDDLHGFTMSRARGGLSDSFAMQLADGNAQVSDDQNIVSGAEVQIDAGYSNNHEVMLVGSVDTPERILANGTRAFQLTGRDRAFKSMRTFVSPFYYPMLSQIKKHDDCDVLDNLYIINSGIYEPDAVEDRIGYTSLAHDGILLSGVPAEAKDCRLNATFETTVDTADADSSFGIVVGYSDNDNYILVRVKTGSVDNVTLEKNVAGTFTALDTQSFSITFNSKYDVCASYEGGHIVVWIKQNAQSDFGGPIIDHGWEETEMPIRTDDGLGKAGVYTRIHSLQVGTLAFGSRSDAVPVDTGNLGDYASLPASGTLAVGAEKIAYTGKTDTSKAAVSLAVDGVGPWRDYENPGGTAGVDFDGEYGVQLDGDGAVQVTTWYDNYAIVSVTSATDDPPRFYAAKIIGYMPEAPDTWVADVDGGEAHVGDLAYGHWADQDARRIITDLSSLGGLVDGDEMRIAPAFYGLTRASADTSASPHSEGDTIALHVDGEIRIHNLVVTDLDKDKSVEWMIKHIAAMAGIHDPEFRSLYENTSLTVTGGGTSAWHDAGTWLTGIDQEGFELSFELPSIPLGEMLGVAMRASDISWSGYSGASIVIEGLGSSEYSVGLFDGGGDTALEKVTIDKPGDGATVRLVSQGEFFTMYINDKFIWTWHSTSFQGTNINYLGFSYYNGSSINLSNVRVPELGERREAAAIDPNKTALSSIGWVLEDRPIELFATNDGNFLASYFDDRDDAGEQLPGGVIGDEIFVEQIVPTDTNFFSVVQVYCEDVVELVDHDLAKEYGFIFYPMQASALSVAEGLKEAQRIMTRAKELRETRSVNCKALLHLQRGDLLPVSYETPMGDSVQETLIVNDMNFKFTPAKFEMKMGARKQVT